MGLWDVMHLWTGRAQVKARAGMNADEGILEGHVAAIALARDEDDFASKVADTLYQRRMDLMAVGDIQRYDTQREQGQIDPELEQLAGTLTEEQPVGLGTFQPM